jgi:lipopolysaccharide/colanic/teichoic acid biosynthesis glycosyltransferase
MTHSTMATNPSSGTLVTAVRSWAKRAPVAARPALDPSRMLHLILSEEIFLGILCLDRKRAERSGNKLALILLDAEDAVGHARREQILEGIVQAANASRRETDPAGWYRKDSVLGIIFAEIEESNSRSTLKLLVEKVKEALYAHLTPADLEYVHMTVHVFSDDSGLGGQSNSSYSMLYPDLLHQEGSKKIARMIKRAMDIAASFAALAVLSPLFFLIALCIKLTSEGPVLFRQERLGQFGSTFNCLKFRTMYANNDPKIHQEFMKRVINGAADGKVEGANGPVYKMTNDPRITGIGGILRRTSLDELPQFINVLKGEMSLVGPRPPLAYEYEEYDVWHRRRVLEAKPGITGLWQVRGRSRVRFDDMVRLDLQYVRKWSLWLDIRILFATPRAVVFGGDAY